jgi:hypothetical protein
MPDMESTPKLLQFSLRTILEITAFAAFILALIYMRAENKNGRYQVTVDSTPSAHVYVIDTITGQVWRDSSRGGWDKWPSIPAP